MIHANSMGNYVGERERSAKQRWDTCPKCGGEKTAAATTCLACRGKRPVKRSEDAMDRHHRYETGLLVGYTQMGMLIAKRPPTPEEINERDPAVAVRWWPEAVISAWWGRGE